MLLKKLMTCGLMMTMVLMGVTAQTKAKPTVRQQGQYSVSKKYASNVKIEDQISKFEIYSDQDILHPADALYSSDWNNERLNPYQAELPDSFKIVVTNFEAPTINKVTSEYGPRWGRFHCGIDIAVSMGDSIKAAFDGEVRIGHKFNKNGYGWYVVIRHENGLETLYGHLKKSLVKNNQRVKAGDVIGLGGNTGRSTGPHLHFETRFLGTPMNPRNIIDFEESVILSDYYTISKDSSFSEWNDFHNPRARYAKGKNGKKGGNMAFMKNGVSYHKVRQGDNLYRIARTYGTSVSALCRLNNINENAILSLGKVLRLK